MNAQAPTVLSSQMVQVQPQLPLSQGRSRSQNTSMDKHKNILFGLGVVEVALGSLSIPLAAVALTIAGIRHGNSYIYDTYTSSFYHYMTYPAQGIWCGICIIVTGILGIRAKSSPTKCMYSANTVMSIIGAIFMVTLMILSCLAAVITSERLPGLVAVHSILAILGFTGVIICIVHSAYCCACGCCQTNQYDGAAAYYLQQPVVQQPQMVQLPNGQYMMVETQPTVGQYPTSAAPIASGNVTIQNPQGRVIMPVTASQQIYPAPNSQLTQGASPLQQQVTITDSPAQAAAHENKQQQANAQNSEGGPPAYNS